MKRNEADTRADLIDPKLQQNGWNVVEGSAIRREVICPGRIMTGGKRGTQVLSDYVLVYQGKKLAVVEAKKESLSYTEGVRQAKDYAKRLQCRIAYATNGHAIYQMDIMTGKESLVENYMTPEQLWNYTYEDAEQSVADQWRKRFSVVPFETKSGSWTLRYYQENAINEALEAIGKGDNRVLLTLATGTGKTAIAFQIAWKLFNSRWSLSSQKNPQEEGKRPRILFLADRNILADQAFNNFGAFGDDALARVEPSEIRKKGKVPKNASVFFTIFQTFMSGKDENGNKNAYFGEYPTDFFDLVIVDECHRGGARDESAWREILTYFSPAVQLGLTATPKRENNVDTYDYFGEPVYSYTLKEGINDGFLTPFKVCMIIGTMDEYIYNPNDGVVIEGEPEVGRLYKEKDFNRIITIIDREKERVKYWMNKINPKEKTLVFCATQPHAGLVRDLINQYANEKSWTTNTNYCVRVTSNDGKTGENDLRIFQDNEKTIPTILTTSRKLSTGVDARNIRNIVLMRPCENMIEFKQIIGRGTRTYENKECFTIYDFVKAYRNFSDSTWDGEPLPPNECKTCKKKPCVCQPIPCDVCEFFPCQCPKVCNLCGNVSCICQKSTCSKCDSTPCSCIKKRCSKCNSTPCSCNEKIVIQLNDGKAREIHSISSTMYWDSHGKPMTGEEFFERLFNDLPNFFTTEDQLREIWSHPETRANLLKKLADAGYDEEKLESMKSLIDAKDSDIYDVLAYIAYAVKIQTRAERVNSAKPAIKQAFPNYKQREFIEFSLNQYVQYGVKELAPSKITDQVNLKYHTITDATRILGDIHVIKKTFLGFQKYLYSV